MENSQNSLCAEDQSIVYDLESMYCLNAPEQSLSSTMKIDQNMYIYDANNYAMLEPLDISNEILKNSDNCLKISADIICKSITLVNFPVGQYTLNFNGINVKTAKCEVMENNISYVFDFSENQTNTLISFVKMTMSENEPVIENRQNYVNLSKIENFKIISNKNFDNNTQYKIMLDGYFKSKNNWITGSITKNTYANTWNCTLNHPTDCIDLHLTKINTLENAKILFLIEGNLYAEHNFEKHQTSIRIKCKDLKDWNFNRGAQNNYLSDEINSNTINFSRVDLTEFVFVNCKLKSGVQWRYLTYVYPSRILRFSN